MSNKKDENPLFGQFIKEDTPEAQHLLHPEELTTPPEAPPPPKGAPQVAEGEPVEPAEMQAFWRNLRLFYRTGKGGGLPLHEGRPWLHPALLSFDREQTSVPSDYPCWTGTGLQGTPACAPFSRLLAAAKDSAPRVLADNLPHLERLVIQAVAEAGDTANLPSLLGTVAQRLVEELALPAAEQQQLREGLDGLTRQLPASGELTGFSHHAHFRLLASALKEQRALQKQMLEDELAPLIQQLEERLEVERGKSRESAEPGRLNDTFDFAGSYINFQELSSVLPEAGSEPMPAERRRRLEQVLDILRQAVGLLFRHEALLLLPAHLSRPEVEVFKQLFSASQVHQVPEGQLCAEAIRSFDGHMGRMAQVVTALRIAELEVRDRYQTEVHGDFFTHFDWRAFTFEEIELCPPVLVFSEVGYLIREELNELSYLISTSRPVKVLAVKHDAATGYRHSGDPEGDEFLFQPELGALGIAYRNTYVLQSTALTPAHLFEGFVQGLSRRLPALWYVLSPARNDPPAENPYRWVSAAVESREFPTFRYDSLAGPQWGSRFDIQSNPFPEKDWPEYSLKVQTKGKEENWTLPFTFADFLAQDADHYAYYLVVPPQFWTGDLVPFADYLNIPDEERYTKTPFIWMEDEEGKLQKVAVSRRIVLLSRERMDLWHYLQENAGVNSYHVHRALAQFQEELTQKTQAEIAALKAAHKAALVAAREEGASTAIERLANALLDLDLDDLTAPVPAATTPKAAQVIAPATETAEAVEAPVNMKFKEVGEGESEEEEDEPLLLGEAYVDTALCTSCNECINLNSRIFKYNEDKQAFVADPKGGPFADIVMAAEKCPAAIIHPGAPQNPNEEELEEWVKRAEPFNR